MNHILVPVDFSEGTDVVLDHAVHQAKSLDAKLWLVHVAPPEPDFVPFEAGPQVVRDQVAADLREEHRRLQRMAEDLGKRGVEVTALMVQGPTVTTLLEQAEKLDCGMIVLGSHGRGMMFKALLGSVSEGVVRHARIPVLIVPVRPKES